MEKIGERGESNEDKWIEGEDSGRGREEKKWTKGVRKTQGGGQKDGERRKVEEEEGEERVQEGCGSDRGGGESS